MVRNSVRILIFAGLMACHSWGQIKAHIYGELISPAQTFNVYLTFGDSVGGLEAADFTVSNGTVTGVMGQARFHTAIVTATAPGDVTVTLNAAAATGDNGTSSASNAYVVNADYDATLAWWKVETDNDWSENNESSNNINFENGMANPTAATATYTSVTQTYNQKMQAQKLTFKQSPVWDNWEGVANVGPSGAGDAPILLSVANDDYYFFGRWAATNLYAAWHSTDMVNWTKYRDIASGNDLGDGHFRAGRWLTSAEYKDGTFYIIGDVPNDEDPHLWMDDDLMDDVPATYIDTAVFNDPSHGSDASIFRNDGDGLFHIIYEDWSPLNARNHAWDSPLGGHTSSPDAITGFEPHEHAPAIDNRTTPTGEILTYSHPGNLDPVPYEVHEPEQEAYGDWTTIKVGSQIYYFADYDPVGGGMSVIRMTSPSIYETAEIVGNLGSGHPDPTVGFAEGQFYLITQQSTDHVSPGPWVNDVEARAGVDEDGNGTIDTWTEWQKVEETYDHKPGYARVVDVTPAELDLTGLPDGFGFKFDFRIDDQVTGAAIPIIDNVAMSLKPVAPANTREAGVNRQAPKMYLRAQGKNIKLVYEVEHPGQVVLSLYNLEGKLLKRYVTNHTDTGEFTMRLEPDELNGGLNIVEYSSGTSAIKKVMLIP